MKPTVEFLWQVVFAAAIKSGRYGYLDATIAADYAVEKYRERFPESNGNG